MKEKELQVATLTSEVIKPLTHSIIEDNIAEIAKQVQNEIAELNIDKMEVSADNKQKLKNVRTTLNKRLLSFEADRKKIKNFILEPYTQFEAKYSSDLKPIFEKAIKQLGDKIDSLEKAELEAFEKYGRDYFKRKLESQPLSVANKFEDAKIEINLSTNNKRIREAIDAHFEKITSALTIINAHEHSTRLHVLWEKNNYDIGTAMVKLSSALIEEKRIAEEKQIFETPFKATIKETPVAPKQEEVKYVHVEPQEVFDFTLKITVTEDQLAELTAFMTEKEIDFELGE